MNNFDVMLDACLASDHTLIVIGIKALLGGQRIIATESDPAGNQRKVTGSCQKTEI